MALIYIESFGHFDKDTMEQKGYQLQSLTGFTVNNTTGRRGTACLDATGVVTLITFNFPVAITDPDMVLGFAFSTQDFTPGTGRIIELFDDTNSKMVKVSINGAGAIVLENSVTATTVQTADSFVPLNTFMYLEVVHNRDNTTGSVELFKDGVSILSISGEDTDRGNPMAAWKFVDGVAVGVKFDDMYLLDGTGATNNSRLGDVRVDVEFMSSDGATTDFIPFSAGANYLQLDEIIVDDDTTFVESGSISDEDYHQVTAPTLGTQIYGVQQCTSHRKTDAGIVTMNLKTVTSGGSGKKTHTQTTSQDSYKMTLAIHDTDPDDSATWTDSKIGNTEWGFSIVNITT